MKDDKNRGLPFQAMTIGQLAKQAGVSPRIIRYYEQVGLFPALPRASNGYRIYTDQHLYGLRLFRRAKRLGFSSHEIKELAKIQAKNPYSEKKIIKRSLEFLESHLESAKKKKRELEDHISLLDSEIKRVNGLL
jgi:DNA-binding transcriptional MerR regulator